MISSQLRELVTSIGYNELPGGGYIKYDEKTDMIYILDYETIDIMTCTEIRDTTESKTIYKGTRYQMYDWLNRDRKLDSLLDD